MKRVLSGSLEHLPPMALLRLVSATSPSGVLELETSAGSLCLEVDRGRVRRPPAEELESAGKVLGCQHGEFRFSPGEVSPLEGEVLSLTAFAEAAGTAARYLEVDRLLEEDFVEISRPVESAHIHVLPAEPPQNPLDDLLADLEMEAPGELLFAQVGVVAQDPRWWRGTLEREWQQRGWQLRHFQIGEEITLEGLELLVVHLQNVSTTAGREKEWLELIARSNAADPPVPVVWVAPLGDAAWVNRLVDAGVSFLLPAPLGDAGEAMTRFAEGLSRVVERQIQTRHYEGHSVLPSGVAELVGALLSDSAPDQGVSSLLHLAAEHFTRGAVLMAEDKAIRCRAGFGYPLNRDKTALPRGVGLIEHVIRTGEALTTIDPEAGGVRHLCGVLGVTGLPAQTAIIPLGRSGGVAAVLVADREGDTLPDFAALVRLAGRLGGAAVS